MDDRTFLQALLRNPFTIGKSGLYGAALDRLTNPLEALYTTQDGAGLGAYGDLSRVQLAALTWLRSDTAAEYAALSRNGAANRATASARGGVLRLLDAGAEVASGPGKAGDVFVTGGCSVSTSLQLTGSTLLTFASANAIAVTGDNNDLFSFGCCDCITVNGGNNTIYGGPGSANFAITGHENIFRGGEGCSTVTLTGDDAAANLIIGGTGSLVVNSTAAVTQFIGGPGDTVMTLSGDYSSLLLGDGSFCGHISGNGINIETGAGTAVMDVRSTGGGVIVTGSGVADVTFTGNGEIMVQGDAAGQSTFRVNGKGITVGGGDLVCATGTGIEVRSRTDALTGYLGSQFATVLNNMGSFASDAVIASAMGAADPTIEPTNVVLDTADAATSSCCWTPPSCAASGARIINMSTGSSAVYADTRYDVITVNGDNNNFYGGSAGRTVSINCGTGNLVWGSAGNNIYQGDYAANVLEYIALPGSSQVPGPVTVNLSLGLARNSYGGLDRICGFTWVEAGTGSTLIGGAVADRLTILGDRGTIRDGLGNDVLTATGSGNTLRSAYGSDVMHTGGQDNIYQIGNGCTLPCAATEIRQDFVGVTGQLQFAAPVTTSQLWFDTDAAGDLLVRVLGTREVVTIDNWFGSKPTQLASITAGCRTIGNADINALFATMNAYEASHAGFDPASAARLPSDNGLANAVAAAWH